jgi:signal transduction histidine kinase
MVVPSVITTTQMPQSRYDFRKQNIRSVSLLILSIANVRLLLASSLQEEQLNLKERMRDVGGGRFLMCRSISVSRSSKQLSAIILLTAWITCTAFAQSASPKRVLLLYETDGTAPGFLVFEQSLVHDLRAAMGANLEFYREHLDSTRFPEFTESRLAEIRSRYANRKIDVVIFQGNTLVDLLPTVPVVQVSNARPNQAESSHRTNLVHVLYNIDALKCIEVVHSLQPRARRVLLITGVGASDHITTEQFQKRLREDTSIEIQVVGDASVDELVSMVSKLSQDTIVMPIAYSRDPAGNAYSSRDIVAKIAAASSVPVYAVSDTYLGVGTVGGYVVSWSRTGELTADAAIQMLRGKDPSSVVLKALGSGIYLFDWRQLKRWGLLESSLPPGSEVEYRTPTAWEQYKWRIIGSVAIMIGQLFLIIALLVHRRRRQQAEGSLREMAGRLLRSQDDERRRIARDLHDGTAQHLSGMALTIGQVLADFPPGHDQLRKLLQDSHVASREALKEVRTVSYVLHPPILDGLGLVPALQWYLDGLQKRSSLRVNFQASADIEGLSPDEERALFRIVQESVNNVLRHSGGTAINIVLSANGRDVTLEIADNGCGMTAVELQQAEGAASLGVGISGMRERVRQLNGTFRISSSSRGTQVFVSLPKNEGKHATNSSRR